MADVITRLKVESQEYDSKIKRAAQGLLQMETACRKVGGTLAVLEKDEKEFVAGLGRMETSSRTAKGKLSELTNAFTDLRAQYNRLTAEEKQGDFGRALSQSLDQLKVRIIDTKKDLATINQELSGSKFGQFGGVIDSIGHKLGLTANATELLTSKTALMYAGIGAGIAIIGKASDAWATYNKELAKQDQITTVTTGLKGTEADHMTDTMRALSDTYKVDFREAINAANVLMTQFGKSGDEAIQLLRDGMQGMIQGDGPKLLSMIQQFAPAFRDAGLSADKLVAIIHNSEGGLFSEQNMSAILMGIKNIRNMTDQTAKDLAKLGINGEEMSRKMSNGSMTVFEALQKVSAALENANSGSKEAGRVMQDVFGRQGAMQGMKLSRAIAELNTNLAETKKQTGELGDAFADLQTANEHLNTAIREAFSYDGWEQMAIGIKSTLIDTLADVIDKLGQIKGLLAGISPSQAKQDKYGTTGTPSEVEKDIAALQAAKENDREEMYQKMLKKYEKRYQASVNEQEKARKTYESGNRGNIIQRYNPLSLIGRWWDSRNVNTSTSNVQAEQEVMNLFKKEAEKVLNGETPKTTNNNNNNTSSGKKTKQQQAQEKYDQAQKDYQQALEQAALEVKAGTSDTVAAKKKELQAAENLWKSIGDAREVYDSEELKKAQEDAAQKVVELGGSVKQLEAEQKKAQEAARELTSAQKKAADAYRNMQDAQANNDLKAYNTARKQYESAQAEVKRLGGDTTLPQKETVEVEYVVTSNTLNVLQELKELEGVHIDEKTMTVTFDDEEAKQKAEELQGYKFEPKEIEVNVEQPKPVEVPVEMSYTESNMSAFISILKEKIAQEDVGSTLYQNLTKQLADANALANLMETAIKNGIDIAQFNPQDLWSKVFSDNPGDYITDEQWKKIEAKINEELKKLNIDPIDLNIQTGDVSTKKGKSTKSDDNSSAGMGQLLSGVSSINSNLSSLGAEIPESLSTVVTVLEAISGILTGISTLVTVISAETSIKSIPIIGWALAGGGIVPRAAGGKIIEGNSYSGDNIFAGGAFVNAGELVLNKAQQGNLASILSDSGVQRGGDSVAIVSSDNIKFVLKNGAQRRGKTLGEYLGV